MSLSSKSAILPFLVILLLASPFKVSGQEEIDKLLKQRVSFQMNKAPLRVVFSYLINECNIPIGFEESSFDQDHGDYFFITFAIPPEERAKYAGDPTTMSSGSSVTYRRTFSLNVNNLSVSDVLDLIVEKMENYQWEIKDGIVNIVPTKGRDSTVKALLEMEISSFSFSQRDLQSDIQPRIALGLPELRIWAEINGLIIESDRYVPGYGNVNFKSQATLMNVTLRQLLNIVSQHKRGGWIVRRKKTTRHLGTKIIRDIEVLI